jgi:hypothetical protein
VPTAVILLSDDSMSVDGTASIAKGSVGGKRKAGGTDTVAISSGNANKRPKKERQPHWNSLEVMVLIHAKEKEHKTYKLTTNPRENMETAAVKWTRISEDVARAGFSNYYRGPIACKDKWQSLFSDGVQTEEGVNFTLEFLSSTFQGNGLVCASKALSESSTGD